MPDDFTLEVKRFDTTDPRLGRHVLHDSRSRRFAAPARDPATLKSVRHEVHIEILQQGNEGACTGNAGENNLGSGRFWAGGAVVLQGIDHHEFARQLYGDATKLDPWPGEFNPATGIEDTGSDGLSVAKVLQQRGLISGYQHAFSLASTLTALAEQVVMVGTTWLNGMYEVTGDGRMQLAGDPAGGHEYVLDELDVEHQRVWMRNSWGADWGLEGRAWMSWDDLGRLLADQGDCTILVPVTEPAPQPTPVPDPQPDPEQDDTNRKLAGALLKILDNHNCPRYLKAPARAWLLTTKE